MTRAGSLPTVRDRVPASPVPASRRWDVWLFLLLVTVANLSLVVSGRPNLDLVLFPDALAAGEWWRLLAHPLVHVSRYHLLLDGVAFLLLLDALHDFRPVSRLAIVLVAALTSAAAAALEGAAFATHGLCGLSGSAHGLMAAAAVPLLRQAKPADRRLGLVMLTTVSAKSAIEAVTGTVVFDLFHLGDLGRPSSLCHLGGVLGGLLGTLFLSLTPEPAAARPRLTAPAATLLSSR